MIRAIAFDLDDTLYPEMQFVYSGYKAVSAEVERQWGFGIYDALVSLFEEGRRGDLFTPVLAGHWGSVDEGYVRHLVEIYRGHEPAISPFPEARDVLCSLVPSYPLGLISDGILSVQERKLKALQLSEFFEVVVFSDRWGREFWKPHPRPYQECALGLGVELSGLAYVGDNPEKDFVMARRLDVGTVRVRREGTLHEHVRLSPEYEADEMVNHLGMLRDWLASAER